MSEQSSPDERCDRNCVNCVHWWWDSGTPDYSDLTPGDSWESSCRKGHWYMRGYRVTEAQFRENMNTANGCADYEERS